MKPFDRLIWADRFQEPSVDELRGGIHGVPRQMFDAVRRKLLEFDTITETLVWYGDCWKWSIEYRTRFNKQPNDPLAVLVPCPDDLQLALPIDREFVQTLPMKRMKRAVRDGLELAQEPFDTRWSVWSLGGANGNGMLDDLHDLVSMKLKHLAKRAATR